MGRRIMLGIILLVVSFVLIAPARAERMAPTAAVAAPRILHKGTITVSGDADIKVIPDEVDISIGVEAWDKDLAIAKEDNDKRVQAVIAAAKKSKVHEKYIQTSRLSITPRYRNERNKTDFIGYFVQKAIVITLKDTDKIDDLLSGVLEAGADQVFGVHFRTTQLRKYRDQARVAAVKAARAKAEDLAAAVGQKVGKARSISEGQIYERRGWLYCDPFWNPGGGYRNSGSMSQNVISSGSSGSGNQGNTPAGQMTVSARVSVNFELE